MFYALIRGRKCDLQKKWRIFIVTLALVLFFSVFSVTEYISSQTGVYEINLYSLFVLPVFLFMIIFAITNLEIFKIRLIGFQLLAYVLIILVGSQIFFIQSSTSKFLTGITFVLSLGFGILLIRSGRREEAARTRAEKLAVDLEQANQQKDAILRMVAHQFRRPVTEINYMTELLLDGTYGPISAEQRESITTIQTASAKMGSQSELVLDAAKITSGKLPIVLAPLDLNVLLTEIVSTAEKYAKELKVQWKVSALPTLPTVMLDRKYTQSALDNLLNNAIKYTALKRTDGSGTVAFTVEQKGQVLSCSVQDNGIGIPEAEKEKMFKELSRASNAGRDGNGLGLHVAKGAIEAQGGSIRFESTVNVGTTFFVTLPLNVATKEDFLLQAAKEKEESNSKRGK
ncbi:MAG: HAMP domain-containing sensor histidine kinase [Candidatus Peregrinibacteria bacterium]